jgi:hypothetical protein
MLVLLELRLLWLLLFQDWHSSSTLHYFLLLQLLLLLRRFLEVLAFVPLLD